MIEKIKNIYSKISLGFITAMISAPTIVRADDFTQNISLNPDGTLSGVGGNGNATQGIADSFNNVYDILRVILQGITGIAALVLVAMFVIKASKLASCGENPNERSKVIQGMIFFAVAAALMGGASFFVGIFFNALS